MRFRESFILFLYLSSIFLTGATSAAGDFTVSPTGSNSAQNDINGAINAASLAGGGTVYLKSGTYLVDGPIIIKSNVKLTGDPDAIIKVSPTGSQWYTGQTGVICNPDESIQNAEICGFQINGNIGNLPKSYADSRSDTAHDCEKLILFGGWSSNLGHNIKIHHMKLYDSFSDGIYIRYSDGVSIYDNTISNCQHEGIYLSCVKNSIVARNHVGGITSDCGRFDNCIDGLVEYNIFFSYNGDSYGAYKGGENGLQIGDAMSSHGYDGSNKPGWTTKNIEVRHNTFADPGLKAIWLHNGENVYIHDNEYINAAVLETMGISVGNISMENQPTIEKSEEVFGGLLEILDIKFVDSARNNQTGDSLTIPVEEKEKSGIRAGIEIAGFGDVVYKNGVPYIPDNDSILVKTVSLQSPAYTLGLNGDVKKEIKTEIRDGKAYATLKMTVKYTTESRNAKGAKVRKHRTVTETFEAEPVPAPAVFPRPDKIKVRIDQYLGGVHNYTTISPYTMDLEGVQRIVYEYDGKELKHVFEVGEHITDDAGIIHTNITDVDYWDGDLEHSGDGLLLEGQDFDENKLKVLAYSIFEEIPTESDYMLHKYTAQRLLSYDTIILLIKVLLMLFVLYHLIKMVY